MHSKFAFVGGLAAAAVFAAACGSSGDAGNLYGNTGSPSPSAPASVAPSASPSASPSVSAGANVRAAGTRLGQVLVGPDGRTLYLFAADKGTRSVCVSSACVQAWPPLLTRGAPQAGPGVDGSLLGTTARADGTTEVTYASHPLYYFIGDRKAGDVTGQAVVGFGGPWYVVAPSGMQIV